jgi:gliding motility-associated-like protein
LNKVFKILTLLGLLIFSSPNYLFSSHLVGGKLTYRYLGNNKYEYKLTVYRDCSDPFDFDSPAYVSIFNKSNNALVQNKGLILLNRSIVPATPPNPCFVPPAGICVEIGNYIDTVTLAPNNQGYTISYQRCCHNASINNIITPNSIGTTITTDIPPQINNSPQFLNFPPIFICFSDTFKYSFASTDIDGDNLVYQLCTPLAGASNLNSAPNPASPPPYLPVSWSNSLNATNPIPNNGGFNFNTSTGQLKFKPSMLGQYAIGICVLEYRNNILINTNRLELQFNIVQCYLTSSIPTASNLCQGLTIPFQNGSTNANAFHWNFGDLTTNADTSNIHTPTYTFPSFGTYTVSLTVFNTAYGFCKDSTKKVINVHPLLSPTLQPTYSSCFKNNNFSFNVGGSFDPAASFSWNFTPNYNSPNIYSNNTTAHFTTPTTKTVSVIINQFGCLDTLNAVVSFTNPIANIYTDNLNCNEKNLTFQNSSSNSNLFYWNFGDPSTSTDSSSQNNPIYNYPNYGVYTVSLIAYNGICSDTTKQQINVFPKLQLNWINTVDKQCLKNNSFSFTPTGIWGNGATFSWVFLNQPSLITSTQQNPTNIHFTNSGYHLIKFSVFENGCSKNAQAIVLVNPNPKANILLSDTIGCEPFKIKFKSITDSLHPIQNYWTINNTLFSDTTINYTFNNAGLYSYSIIVKDTNNCTDTVSKINYIQINPTPKVKSVVSPFYASILDPRITFVDSTILIHNTNYNFGDGAYSTQTNTIHSYQSTGEFNYSLIVSNQYGCADTANGIIYIDDISSNYIPNIFTPNGDGVNDIFFITGKNITNSTMQIFNRWGALVCNSSNALIGWNGINQNNNTVASDGMYFYVIEITLGNNRKYKFEGNVTLLK